MKKALSAILCSIPLLLLTWFVPCPGIVGVVSAAGFPDHPIQMIIPYPPGSTADITGRMLAEELGQAIGGKVIVVNKPGAGTTVGAEAVVRAKKDGYTIFYSGSSPFVYAPITTPDIVHYDPVKDFEPLGLHYYLPNALLVKADAPWRNFKEFVDYAKKNPGKIRISSIGVGTSTHFAIEMLQAYTGIKLTHVPFEGGQAVIMSVLGGHVEATLGGFANAKPHVDAGRMRMLLIDVKMADYPQVPTLKELGYKESLSPPWFGVFAASGIPEDAKKILVSGVEKAVKATKARVEAMGSICEYKNPQELRRIRDDEYKTVSEIAARLGIGNVRSAK